MSWKRFFQGADNLPGRQFSGILAETLQLC